MRVALVWGGENIGPILQQMYVKVYSSLRKMGVFPIIVTDSGPKRLRWPSHVVVRVVPGALLIRRVMRFFKIPGIWLLEEFLTALLYTASLKNSGTDLVHTGNPFIPMMCRIFAPELRVMFVCLEPLPHDGRLFGLRPSYFVRRKALEIAVRLSDRVFCSSRHLGDQVATITEARHKISVVHYGVDAKVFSPSKRSEAVRKRYGLQGSFAIVFVGRLSPEKNVEVLLEALHDVLERTDVPVKLSIIGPFTSSLSSTEKASNYAKKVVSVVKDMGLEGSVQFLGPMSQDELSFILPNCDVLVLPSRREAFGRVIIEAMASGIPVIGSKVGGISEIISSTEAGLTFEWWNARDLADKLLWLISNKADADSLGAKGREIAVKDYNWERFVEELVSVYKLTAKSRP